MAAAIAYYTVFSLPGLLAIIVSFAGYVFSQQAVESAIQRYVTSFIGPGAAAQVATMTRAANQHTSAGILGTIIGAVVLLAGATTAFSQLQTALNRAWDVRPDDEHQGVRGMLKTRVLSFLLILLIGFLLLVSVGFSTAFREPEPPLRAHSEAHRTACSGS